MTDSNSRSRGAIAIVIVVMVLLIAALGFVGWRMLTRQNDGDQTAKTSQSSAEVILTQDDLDAATKSLDDLDFSDENAKTAELQADL